MTNCVIEDAISDVDGTAVFIRGDSSGVIDSWIIRNNDGSDGGGPAVTINTVSPGFSTIRDCQILGNRSDFLAGGIHGYNSPVRIEGCVVRGNFGLDGAGIYVRTGATLINNTVHGNITGFSGR